MDANDTAQTRLAVLMFNEAARQKRALLAGDYNDVREVRRIASRLIGFLTGTAEAMRADALLHQAAPDLPQA